jgi:hypothetical protein
MASFGFEMGSFGKIYVSGKGAEAQRKIAMTVVASPAKNGKGLPEIDASPVTLPIPISAQFSYYLTV